MDIEPLPNASFGIRGLDDRVGGAVPNRYFGPRSAMRRCRPYAVAECRRRDVLIGKHRFECLLDGSGGSIRKSGNEGTAGKNLGIGGQHHSGHGGAGGQSGYEHAPTVHPKVLNGMFHHLLDGKRFAVSPPGVARQEPRKTILGIVRLLLLRIENDETKPIRERRPTSAAVVFFSSLTAAVQGDHQGGTAQRLLGPIKQHPEIAGIRAERGQLLQALLGRRSCLLITMASS